MSAGNLVRNRTHPFELFSSVTGRIKRTGGLHPVRRRDRHTPTCLARRRFELSLGSRRRFIPTRLIQYLCAGRTSPQTLFDKAIRFKRRTCGPMVRGTAALVTRCPRLKRRGLTAAEYGVAPAGVGRYPKNRKVDNNAMRSSEALQAVNYAAQCYLAGRAVYGGSSGNQNLQRIEAAVVTGGGSIIFAVEFGTRQRLLFHVTSFEMYTARCH